MSHDLVIALQNEEGDGTNYAANSGTIGRAGLPSFPGAGDMMTEMASRLRERRIKAEGGQVTVSIREAPSPQYTGCFTKQRHYIC